MLKKIIYALGRWISEQVNTIVALLISIGCLTVLYWDLDNLYTVFGSKLAPPHLILIGLAILPWAGNFISSIKLSASGIEADFHNLEQGFEDMLQAQGEPDHDAAPEAPTSSPATPNSSPTIDSIEKSILMALKDSRYTLRSWSGVRDDANNKGKANLRGKIETVLYLSDLESNGLAKSIVGPKSRKTLWSITPDGYRALSNTNTQ